MKNAFTLVELLAIIVILSIVVIITTATSISIIQNSKESLLKSQKDMVLKAAEKWAINNSGIIIEKNSCEVSINQLYESDLLESNDIEDPQNTKNKLCGNITILYDIYNKKFIYTYEPTSESDCNVSTENLCTN